MVTPPPKPLWFPRLQESPRSCALHQRPSSCVPKWVGALSPQHFKWQCQTESRLLPGPTVHCAASLCHFSLPRISAVYTSISHIKLSAPQGWELSPTQLCQHIVGAHRQAEEKMGQPGAATSPVQKEQREMGGKERPTYAIIEEL